MSRKSKNSSGLTAEESKLWQKVTRGIQKLESNHAATPFVRKSVHDDVANRRIAADLQKKFTVPVDSLTPQNFSLHEADHHWQQRLRRGKARLDGKIDLHGMTRERAYAALCRKIEQSHAQGHRMILVVTGKGGPKSDYDGLSGHDFEQDRGVLKTNVPRWLSEGPLASKIVAFYSASQGHGGEGALYVVLKKNRSS